MVWLAFPRHPERYFRRMPKAEKENPFYNLGFNLVIPIVLLSKGSDWFGLSPSLNLIISLAFPLGYGVYDFFTRKKFNFVSLLGFVSVLLTGGIGLLKLPSEWIAIKEAAIPLALGLAVLISAGTKYPLVKVFLMNPEVVERDLIHQRLEEKNQVSQFDALLKSSTWLVAGSLFLSAILNFVVAKIIVKSPSGTEAFNAELARMQGLSYIVILVPCMAVMIFAMIRLFKGIKRLTGLDWEDFIVGAKSEEKEARPT